MDISSCPGAISTTSPSTLTKTSPPCIGDHLVDGERVVVGGCGEDADTASLEPLPGVADPLDDPLADELLEAGCELFGVSVEVGHLVGGHARRVVAQVGDAPLQGGGAISVYMLGASHHLGPVPVGGLHQRDHQLPGEVPTEDEQVGVVEPGGGDELPPAKLRAVEVGGEEEGDLVRPACSPHQ